MAPNCACIPVNDTRGWAHPVPHTVIQLHKFNAISWAPLLPWGNVHPRKITPNSCTAHRSASCPCPPSASRPSVCGRAHLGVARTCWRASRPPAASSSAASARSDGRTTPAGAAGRPGGAGQSSCTRSGWRGTATGHRGCRRRAGTRPAPGSRCQRGKEGGSSG